MCCYNLDIKGAKAQFERTDNHVLGFTEQAITLLLVLVSVGFLGKFIKRTIPQGKGSRK